MITTAQDLQKLLTDAIKKQMVILGPQITLLKVHNVGGLTVTADGSITQLATPPQDVVARFVEQFRDLSAPLVKKTMKPLLNAIEPTPQTTVTNETQASPVANQEHEG